MTREEAIRYIDGLHYEEDFPYTDTIADFVKERNEAIDMAIEALKADAVDVVRCKDCKHAYYADNRVPHERTWVCERFMNEEINANDFCSFGERSEE